MIVATDMPLHRIRVNPAPGFGNMRRLSALVAKCGFLALLLALGVIAPCAAQSSGDAELRKLVRQLYAEGKFHGGILVADSGRVVLREAWGVADQEAGRLLTPEDHFTLNSLGKMFTAIAVMQLVEEGELALADPLSRHLPDFAHARADEITIHMLLAHRSGVPDYHFQQVRGELPWDADANTIVSTAATRDLEFEPGTKFHYSNTGYLLLGRIIEAVSGRSYHEVVQRGILQPLGMTQTVYDPSQPGIRMTNYYAEDGEVISGKNLGRPMPGDGGYSTLDDLHRFMTALGSERLLRRESWDLVFTAHSLPSEVPENAWPPPHRFPYGYGFSLTELPFRGAASAIAVGAGGAGNGSNYVARFLESDRVIIIWNNIFKPPLLLEVFEHLAGVPARDGN